MIKRNYITACILAGLVSAPISAADEKEQTIDPDIDRIEVTGSRIARDPNLISPSPVASISAKEIKQSGEFSITDIVNDIPALFSSTSSESSIDSGFADGSNILSLRGLGSNRTLVLVNGRRHVGGAQGSGAVDVGSIPTALIESVEVLTGGASAIYGADAVTGVVNFILKDDFEGFEVDIQQGISSEGDGEQTTISSLFGTNYDDGRGNFTLAVSYAKDQGLRVSERENGAFIGSGRDWLNPAKRFQQGDINADSMPNFARFYLPNNDRPKFGLPVPGTADEFITAYTNAFDRAPNLTQAELDFIAAAAAAPNRAVLPGRTFPFTSGYGLIIPGNPFTFDGFDPATNIDLNNNGVPDCYDSWTGYNSSFGSEAFGVLGGCWNVTADGQYRPVQDGLVANGFQGFGGDSFNTIQQQDGYIIIPDEKINLNLTTQYELNDSTTVFAEAKYVTQETENEGQPTSFWDLLFGAPDNPFLPEFIQPIADQTGGVAITIDPIGLGAAKSTTTRDTYRFVLGAEGELDNGFMYEVSAYWNRFDRRIVNENSVIVDRFFAAIDAVTDPGTGEAACRVEVDSSAPAQTTPFDIPAYDPGYYSFQPGSGQCVPLNIWAGQTGITQQAVDWVTTDNINELTIDQWVVSGFLNGDSADWFELPAGPVVFAVGAEYREESSESKLSNLQKGIIPANSAFPEGTNIADVSDNASLTFRPALSNRDEFGEYDVWDIFAELSIPLLVDLEYAEELTLDLAMRVSDYSTVGRTSTWKANLIYTPISDLSIRTSFSKAVRAPNITELFGPETGTTFRPTDPCDASQIASVAEQDSALAASIQQNCVTLFNEINYDPFDANGDYAYSDPLTAAFGGVTGGNAELKEETADTVTFGFVYQPEQLPGFSITVDRWDITIDDAVSFVSAQNIVDGCYRNQSLNREFCSLFSRNSSTGGFNFLRTTNINFASLETSGFDFSLGYETTYDEHTFNFKVSGTQVYQLDQFINPSDLTQVDPELGEINRPELAGNIYVSWEWQDLNISWQSQYMDEQVLGFVEIEQVGVDYDNSVIMDEFWQHDISFNYVVNQDWSLYGGVKNLTDEVPFITNFAYPASPRGRFFYVGANIGF